MYSFLYFNVLRSLKLSHCFAFNADFNTTTNLKGMKDNLLRFISTYVNSDVINRSSRPEWLPCLHNVSFLHGAIQLRARFPSCVGWQRSEAFASVNSQHLMVGKAMFSLRLLFFISLSFLGCSQSGGKRIQRDSVRN